VKYLVLLAAAALAATPAEARISKAAADARCHAGEDDPDGRGSDWNGGLRADVVSLTPYEVSGAKRVSPDEADCLVFAYDREVRFITPITDQGLVPFSIRIPQGGDPGSFSDESQVKVASELRKLTGGDLNYPLIAYCHNRDCYLSYNLVLRAAALGYRNLYWMREGIEGWQRNLNELVKAPVNEDQNASADEYTAEIWICRGFYAYRDRPTVDGAASKRAFLDQVAKAAASAEYAANADDAALEAIDRWFDGRRAADAEARAKGASEFRVRLATDSFAQSCDAMLVGGGYGE
jgi:hypothetical protein